MIIESILGYLFIGIFFGFIMGVLEKLIPKIYLIGFVIGCGVLIILMALNGGPGEVMSSMVWYEILTEMIGVIIGIKSGNNAYRIVWEEND